MGTDDMPLVLRKRLEEALKSRSDLLKDSHDDNVLIQLPKRFNVNVFEDEQLYTLVEAMIRARADELLKDANAMQSIINEIHVASERKPLQVSTGRVEPAGMRQAQALVGILPTAKGAILALYQPQSPADAPRGFHFGCALQHFEHGQHQLGPALGFGFGRASRFAFR